MTVAQMNAMIENDAEQDALEALADAWIDDKWEDAEMGVFRVLADDAKGVY